MNEALAWSIGLPAAYLLGSVPIGVIVGKLTRGVDVRNYGSGSTGATNVMRTLGPVMGIAVLALDWGKGAAAVFIARALSDSSALSASAALLVVVGHSWPVFAKFRGGKGVATGLGALTIISPLGGGLAALGAVVAVITRYVSVGSMAGTAAGLATLIYLIVTGRMDEGYLIFAIGGFLLIELRHWKNAVRLFKGTENRLNTIGRPRRARASQVKAGPSS
jgi:acyl phosphate:glycerol-3-phosphate acyltransferase